MTENSKPYRNRGELVIWNNRKVLVTVNHTSDGGVWHGLPGGGVDDGENVIEAVTREALEEVGVSVRNVKDTGYGSTKEKYRSAHSDREEKYRGSKTQLFEASFHKVDKSQLDADGDAVEYIWLSPKEAHDLFETHIIKNGGGSGDHAVRYFKTKF